MRPLFVNPLVTRVSIRLQCSGEVAQVRLRMFSLAIRRVAIPHRRRCLISSRPIVSHICPQPASFCFSSARRQHRHRRVIAVNLVSGHHVTAQRFHQRREQPAGSSHPVRQCRAIQLHSFACIDLRLPIQRADDHHTSETNTWANSPGPAMPRSIGRLGAAACTMRSQPAQASLGRTCRITLKRTSTYSRISDTSSPSGFNVPPQSGQAFVLWQVLARFARQVLRQSRRTGHWHWRLERALSRSNVGRPCFPPGSFAALPVEARVVRSDDRTSPKNGRTACAATWRSVASNARFRRHAMPVARAFESNFSCCMLSVPIAANTCSCRYR